MAWLVKEDEKILLGVSNLSTRRLTGAVAEGHSVACSKCLSYRASVLVPTRRFQVSRDCTLPSVFGFGDGLISGNTEHHLHAIYLTCRIFTCLFGYKSWLVCAGAKLLPGMHWRLSWMSLQPTLVGQEWEKGCTRQKGSVVISIVFSPSTSSQHKCSILFIWNIWSYSSNCQSYVSRKYLF